MLALVDLQVKACGVTFAQSTERVIEEKVKAASQAEAIRARCVDILGSSLTAVKAGSPEAQKVKQALIEADMWSQYLEGRSVPMPRFSPRRSLQHPSVSVPRPLSSGLEQQSGTGNRAGGEQPRRGEGGNPWHDDLRDVEGVGASSRQGKGTNNACP